MDIVAVALDDADDVALADDVSELVALADGVMEPEPVDDAVLVLVAEDEKVKPVDIVAVALDDAEDV